MRVILLPSHLLLVQSCQTYLQLLQVSKSSLGCPWFIACNYMYIGISPALLQNPGKKNGYMHRAICESWVCCCLYALKSHCKLTGSSGSNGSNKSCHSSSYGQWSDDARSCGAHIKSQWKGTCYYRQRISFLPDLDVCPILPYSLYPSLCDLILASSFSTLQMITPHALFILFGTCEA